MLQWYQRQQVPAKYRVVFMGLDLRIRIRLQGVVRIRIKTGLKRIRTIGHWISILWFRQGVVFRIIGSCNGLLVQVICFSALTTQRNDRSAGLPEFCTCS